MTKLPPLTEPFSTSDLEWYKGRYQRLLSESTLKDGEYLPPILAKQNGSGTPDEDYFVSAYNLNAYTPEHDKVALQLFSNE